TEVFLREKSSDQLNSSSVSITTMSFACSAGSIQQKSACLGLSITSGSIVQLFSVNRIKRSRPVNKLPMPKFEHQQIPQTRSMIYFFGGVIIQKPGNFFSLKISSLAGTCR